MMLSSEINISGESVFTVVDFTVKSSDLVTSTSIAVLVFNESSETY